MTSNAPTFQPAPAHREWRDAAETPLLMELPAGEFTMGENSGDKFANDTERPAHRVGISPGLAMGRFQVTVSEFRCFRPDHAMDEAGDLPVVQVNWHDAQAYCGWLETRTGRAYRLPSEAEWEYACRASSPDLFAFGDALTPAMANFLYDENGLRVGTGRRTPAGSYPPNRFGLYDLHGNVCEWVEDTWHPNYNGAPGDGRAWVQMESPRRVVRGGAWDYLPRLLRSAWRDWRFADERADNVGFRVAADS